MWYGLVQPAADFFAQLLHLRASSAAIDKDSGEA